VQHEREPLGRVERLEDDEERQADGVGEQRLLLGIDLVVEADDRLGEPAVGRLLLSGTARPEHVEADTRYHGGQPPAEVVDRSVVGAAQPQPRLLDRVIALVEGAEHPIGDPPQVRALLLELRCEPVAVAHRASPS
jgi:hypothetical protein